ncbi:MAG: hypothetical protein NC236_02895 [Mycoplasma sp.]|nr:hypothetical protein [Mycoplasma sp.]
MNNNIQRITRGIAEACYEAISVAYDDKSAKKEIMRGGGSNGGILTRLLMPRPMSSIRISQNALDKCIEHNVAPFDYFILTRDKLKNKYGQFFRSNKKDIEKAKADGQFLTADHNIPNRAMLEKMFETYEKDPENCSVSDFIKILNEQSYDLITLEENKKINEHKFKSKGTKIMRENLGSKRIEFTDLWLTPKSIINDFFNITNLNKSECFDPCASDGRWLGNEGKSIDIIPTSPNVEQKDFLTLTKKDIPENIKYIVGNLPFSLLDEFVEKSLELVDECYFLVNGDTIMRHFPKNIKHIYIFSGLEGNQRDNRSRAEFDVPFLVKSALWTCIVHITKKDQPKWTIEQNLTNEEKRDGYHVALGKNTYIKSEKLIDQDPRISRIQVKSEINWKGGKSIEVDGKKIDLKTFSNVGWNEAE